MKKIIAGILTVCILVSTIPTVFATNNYQAGTEVVYTAENNENWTITVPAKLNPGQSSTVTLDGYWPDNKTVTVTAEKTVTLKNSIKASDTKTLNITFLGISEAGSNTSKQTFTETVSVEGISNALFGTWSGKFNYNVDSVTNEGASPDTPLLTAYAEGDYIYTPINYNGNMFGASTLEEAWQMFYAQLEAMGMTYREFVDMCTQQGITEEQLKAEMGLTEETFAPATVAEWSVAINEEKTDRLQESYGPILETVSGAPVTDMYKTFAQCVNMTIAPRIPAYVNTLGGTFDGCTSLSETPDLSYLTNLTDLGFTFTGCTALTEAPVIPDGVQFMTATFQGCTALIETPDIPDSVQSMVSTFADCQKITKAPHIPNGVTDLTYTFTGCYELAETPDIPDSVTNMSCTFSYCRALTVAPTIPEGVTDLTRIFDGCYELKTYEGSVDPDYDFSNYEIPINVIEIWGAFENCRLLTKVPPIPQNVTNIKHMFKGCASLTIAPVIPSYITDLSHLFEGCTSLTGIVEINANTDGYGADWYCFGDVDFAEQKITLTGTAPNLDTIGAYSSKNYCPECNGYCNTSH